MKSVQSLRHQETAALLLLFCFISSINCAVFYTQSRDNDYPRIGRRAFFTGEVKGSSYPRIGRSSPSTGTGSSTGNGNAHAGYDESFHSPSKRGLFTDGGGNFPRVGRRGLAAMLTQSPDLSADALMTSLDVPDVLEMQDDAAKIPLRLPLGLLFFSFDTDGDKMLSREEFVEGMSSARADGTVCR